MVRRMKGRARKEIPTYPTCENLLRIGDSSLRPSREPSFPHSSIWQAMAIQKKTFKNILKIKTLHPRSESLAVDHLRPRPRRAKSPPNQRVPGAAARQKDHPALLHRKGTHILLSLPGTHLLSRTSLKRKIVAAAPRDPEHPLTLTGGLRALTSGRGPRGVLTAANSAAAAAKISPGHPNGGDPGPRGHNGLLT